MVDGWLEGITWDVVNLYSSYTYSSLGQPHIGGYIGLSRPEQINECDPVTRIRHSCDFLIVHNRRVALPQLTSVGRRLQSTTTFTSSDIIYTVARKGHGNRPWLTISRPWLTNSMPWLTISRPWLTNSMPWLTISRHWLTNSRPWLTNSMPWLTISRPWLTNSRPWLNILISG
jgi:hypothetical protein